MNNKLMRINQSLLPLVIICLGFLAPVFADNSPPGTEVHKPATSATQAHQMRVRQTLPFDDDLDFELAQRGLIRKPDNLEITDDSGRVVWSLTPFSFLQDEDHASINPSLHRQARLNLLYGLFEVSDRIYQVRGYDLAHMTFIKGDTGWIVFDALTTPATSRAAYQLISEEFGELPIHAVIYSHAHADHFGGIQGIVSPEQVARGDVSIIAPRDFMSHAIKENVLAGNAMARRATYQYGNTLEKSPTGMVDAAIGKGLSLGSVGLIAPTRTIEDDLETMVIDGVEMVFQNTPGTESPAEMNTWFPQFKALWLAENVIGTMHNIYTLRGAATRDALAWSKYINEAIYQFGPHAEVLFASHSWPRWGNQYLNEVLRNQRDLYAFFHNQTLHLANQGVTFNQIADRLEVPKDLSQIWYNRGYHGSYRHNAQAVINRYLGYFDMNPANLEPLPLAESSKRYVEAMGGADQVLKLSQTAFGQGDYQWASTLLSHLLVDDPSNLAARQLQADAFEQLGYQAENAGMRNIYLTGAQELRVGLRSQARATDIGPDVIQTMSTELLLDLLAVRLDATKASGVQLNITLRLPDRDEVFALEIRNSTLTAIEGHANPSASVTVTIDRSNFEQMLLEPSLIPALIETQKLQMTGTPRDFFRFLGMLAQFEFWFDIVPTPLSSASEPSITDE